MIKLILAFYLLVASNAYAQEWYSDWPSSLDADTQYYRGQRTDLATFSQLIDMLVNPNSNHVISSRMYRTFQAKFPKLRSNELKDLANQQYEFWKNEGILGWISDCHADPYMCSLPKIKQLMGVAFNKEHLPEGILQKLRSEMDESFVLNEKLSKAEILEFFDPIVSTSYRLDIANSFGNDKNGHDGYVLILNDRHHRSCSAKRKETANCFINNEEFMEELEFPMWGYVSSSELDGVSVGSIVLQKHKKDQLKVLHLVNKKEIILSLHSSNSCQIIKKINAPKAKTKRLKESLSLYFKCSK
jgi:hypothetical protein